MATTIPKETIALDIELSRYTDITDPEVTKDLSFYNSDITEVTGPGKIILAASASDVQLNFQGLSKGKILSLHSEQEFTIKINSSGMTAFPAKNFILHSATGISSLYLGNADTSNKAIVEYFIGDDTEAS